MLQQLLLAALAHLTVVQGLAMPQSTDVTDEYVLAFGPSVETVDAGTGLKPYYGECGTCESLGEGVQEPWSRFKNLVPKKTIKNVNIEGDQTLELGNGLSQAHLEETLRRVPLPGDWL